MLRCIGQRVWVKTQGLRVFGYSEPWRMPQTGDINIQWLSYFYAAQHYIRPFHKIQ